MLNIINKLISILVVLLFFILLNDICRSCAAFFTENKLKTYFEIKNPQIARILIARQISRDKFVERQYYHRLCILGVWSYIFIEPGNILGLIVGIMLSFNDELKVKLIGFYQITLGITSAIGFIFLILLIFNTNRVNK